MTNINAGLAVTGSFCTFSKVLTIVRDLTEEGMTVRPILSYHAGSLDTRFYEAQDFREKLAELTGREIIDTIQGAEPIGPKKYFDVLIVAPCTGNTLAKLSKGITDTPVTMAVKSHIRNDRPVIIAVSTNDGLGASCENLGKLLTTKNYFFVPFGQDDYVNKPKSLVFKPELVVPTIKAALEGRQLQPILV